MPNLASTITGFVKGDHLDIVRTVTGIPAGQVLAQAIFTVRAVNMSTIIFSKTITSTNSPTNGQITDTGADGTGEVLFRLQGGTTGDTVLLAAGTAYPFDIQTKTDANKYYTPEVGTITSTLEVTQVD
jgi:hypothetical protein